MKRETIRVVMDIEVVQLIGLSTMVTGKDTNMAAKDAANAAVQGALQALTAWGEQAAGRAVGALWRTDVLPDPSALYPEVRQ